MPSITLSVLDQSPVSEGMSGGDALGNSIDLGQFVDRLGYTRYWVAEHHGTRMLAGTSPEILIGPIAAASRRIRVGSGGVMLPHYSPFKVAENFSVLSALYPGRIDLAVGRAAGTDPATAYVLQRDRRHAAPDDFPEQLVELLAYVRDGLPPAHRFARLAHLAGDPERPQPWLLGSSPQSAVWASELGLPYAFADFINPNGAEAARRYRATFTPSAVQPHPYVVVAVWALAADSGDEAEYLASSARMAFAHFLQGQPIPVPPPDRAMTFLRESPELAVEVARRRRAIVGDAVSVRAAIAQVIAEYQADEAMVVTITSDHQARRRSYELLAG
ncbi:MAG: LLM class flavin-dependent oxidoreductase [Acidobacteriaceae bacterium]|jgi:luciferase family oxidoreductase group 1|nr:LLM class flavin-dependent oxidoreductase [Acidobacteriaceae bacterium]